MGEEVPARRSGGGGAVTEESLFLKPGDPLTRPGFYTYFAWEDTGQVNIQYLVAQSEEYAQEIAEALPREIFFYVGPDQVEHQYTVMISPKMLGETLAVSQAAIGLRHTWSEAMRKSHIDRLQRLIDECERKRPTAVGGKHGDLHTPECGCR